MVDKPKKKSTKPKQGPQGVLGGLPAERPARIGTRNGAGAATTTGQSPKPTRKPRAASTRAASPTGATKPRAASTRRKATAPRTFEPTEAAEAAAKPRAPRTRSKAAAPRTFEPTQAAEAAAADAPPAEPKPRPVRAAAPKMGTSSERAQPPREPERPSGTELVTTAVQAAGELAQVGLSIGGQLVKRALERVPKP